MLELASGRNRLATVLATADQRRRYLYSSRAMEFPLDPIGRIEFGDSTLDGAHVDPGYLVRVDLMTGQLIQLCLP